MPGRSGDFSLPTWSFFTLSAAFDPLIPSLFKLLLACVENGLKFPLQTMPVVVCLFLTRSALSFVGTHAMTSAASARVLARADAELSRRPSPGQAATEISN
ncbi:MAG: hypothetical protein RLZZ555_762 [Pseudomonadota bacterium]